MKPKMTEEEFKELDELVEKMIEWRRTYQIAKPIFLIGITSLMNIHENLRAELEGEEIIKTALKSNS